MANWPEFDPEALLGRLVHGGVDFVVVGGIAMVAHGSSRLTQDLDICYAGDEPNLDALGSVLTELHARLRGLTEDVPFVPDGRTLRRTQILTLDTDLGPLDLLADPAGSRGYDVLRSDAEPIQVGDARVLIASLGDLAAMKRAAGRAKDQIDLEEIEVIRARRSR